MGTVAIYIDSLVFSELFNLSLFSLYFSFRAAKVNVLPSII